MSWAYLPPAVSIAALYFVQRNVAVAAPVRPTYPGLLYPLRSAAVWMVKDDQKSPRVPALMHATLQGHLDTIEYLLEQGADVEQADSFGFTPIDGCAFKGEADACAMLLEHAGGGTSQPATRFHNDGLAPIHRACMAGHTETVRAFLNAGADPDTASRCERACDIVFLRGPTRMRLFLNGVALVNLCLTVIVAPHCWQRGYDWPWPRWRCWHYMCAGRGKAP